MRQYEQVVTGKIGTILFPVAPDNLMAIANEGEISREMAEYLEWAYGRFEHNIEELEHLSIQLKLLPSNRNESLQQTVFGISMFFVEISNEMDNNDLTTLVLDDNQIEQFKSLHKLSSELRGVENSYRAAYNDRLIDVKSKYWVDMFKEMSSVIVQLENVFGR